MRLTSFLTGAALCVTAAVTAPSAAQAMPLSPPTAQPPSLVTQVHDGIHWRHQRPYWRGHRGYPHRRPGYRYYGGYWFPGPAFGIIITPTPEPTYQLTERHYRWCDRRYRSFRRWDNSWQPYHGPRKQCVSPYMYRVR